jgi:hypothetical protein
MRLANRFLPVCTYFHVSFFLALTISQSISMGLPHDLISCSTVMPCQTLCATIRAAISSPYWLTRRRHSASRCFSKSFCAAASCCRRRIWRKTRSTTKAKLAPTAANRTPIAGFSSRVEVSAELSGCAVPAATSSLFGVDDSIVEGARPTVDVAIDGKGEGEAAVAAAVTIVVPLDGAVTRCFVISRRHAANVVSPGAPQRLFRSTSQRR